MGGFGLRKRYGSSSSIVSTCFVSLVPPPEKPTVSAVGAALTKDVCQASYDDLDASRKAFLNIPIQLTEAGEYFCSIWTDQAHMDNDVLINVERLLSKVIKDTTRYFCVLSFAS